MFTALPEEVGGATMQDPADECNYDGNNGPVGGFDYCDVYSSIYCSAPRYSCRLDNRTGTYASTYEAYCGFCRLSGANPSGAPASSAIAQPRAGAHTAPAGPVLARVSVGAAGVEALGASITPALSADGRFVAFDSTAANLVAGDANGLRDVFVHDRTLGQTERVSVASDGGEGNGDSLAAAISADGRFVAFLSQATNLVAGDTNAMGDVFVRDRQSGQTERVNLGPGGVQAAWQSTGFFGNGIGSWPNDAYSTQEMDHGEVAISADGRYVAFVSDADNLLGPGLDTNRLPDVFLRDRQLNVTTRVSVGTGGVQITASGGLANMRRPHIAMSSDARFVAFSCSAAADASDVNGRIDVYVHDRLTSVTTLESVGAGGVQGDRASAWPTISDDGRYVAFASEATNLVPGEVWSGRAIFVRDRQLTQTNRIPLRGGPPMFMSGRLTAPAMSGDGRWVAFAGAGGDIYVFNRVTGSVHLATRSAAPAFGPAVSGDGQVLAFASASGALTTGDTNGQDDVFVTGTSEFVLNGTFDVALSPWLVFGNIVWSVTGGRFEFHRPSSTQAVVFQSTTAYVPEQTSLLAQFDLGNSGSTRKRVSVLVHDGDFSDLAVCTFWLGPNAPLRRYEMQTSTTKTWINATMSIYAASVGNDGGAYQLDNVSLREGAGPPEAGTTCFDPAAPVPTGGAPGPELIANGAFSAGLASWGVFGQLGWQLAGGVFEFVRPSAAPNPAGVLLQPTGVAVAAGEILTAAFDLGNSSPVRKRVTVLVHDLNFTDLSACTFWLAPGQPLSTYTMRTFATQSWANATISFYASTIGNEAWTRLDNVSLRATPGAATAGTDCVEPGVPDAWIARDGHPAGVPATERWARVRRTAFDEGVGWVAAAVEPGQAILGTLPLDLREATNARLRFSSLLASQRSAASVQVSVDGALWRTVAWVSPTDDWADVTLDLGAYAGTFVWLRFVLDAAEPALPPHEPDVWWIGRLEWWMDGIE